MLLNRNTNLQVGECLSLQKFLILHNLMNFDTLRFYENSEIGKNAL